MTNRIDESHALAFAALVGPTVALYNALGVAPLFTLVAVVAVGLGWRRRPWRQIWMPGTGVLIGVVTWMAVSMVWTIELPQSLYTFPRLIAMVAGGSLLIALAGHLDDKGRRRVRIALATGVTVALGLAVVEIYLGGPGTMVFYTRNPSYDSYIPRLGRGLTVSAILLVPAMVAAWRSGFRLWSAAILTLGGLAFVGGHTLSAKIALAIMPMVFLATSQWPRSSGKAISAVVAAVVLAFPLLAWAPSPQETADRFPFLPNSAHHRLTIWTFTATQAWEHPLRGWGLEASRSIPGGQDEVTPSRFNARLGRMEQVSEQLMPLHPHNGPGQIWLELGGIGALLVCALAVMLGRVIAATPNRADAAMTASAMASAFIVACVSYGVWQSWWIGSLWITAALATAVSEKRTLDGNTATMPQDRAT